MSHQEDNERRIDALAVDIEKMDHEKREERISKTIQEIKQELFESIQEK